MSNAIKGMRRMAVAALAAVLLPSVMPIDIAGQDDKENALPVIAPQIPKADRNGQKRVFLERANELKRREVDDYMIVTGNVMFSHGDMLMYCDSAHFYPDTESLDAFGNVKMEQGDTLFVFADELNYLGDRHIAYLYGTDIEPVKMINRDVTLTTPVFIYDMLNEFGYYTEGGDLRDEKNLLVSLEGQYIPATKEANFFTNVELTSLSKSDTLLIFTDTLYYNTGTHMAELVSPSRILNAQATITTDQGVYNTESSVAELYNRSKVVASTGTTLEGDTLFYDRNLGFGEAFGNMEIVDSAHSVIFNGDYGYYNELADSSFATGHALAREYSQGDTLYLHGKYIFSFTVTDTTSVAADTVKGTKEYTTIDTTHVMVAHPRVRFYRNDMQGVCDSLRFEERDSMMYMYHHPIVWSGERQVFGNVIQVHLNDSTIDKAILPDFAFTAEHVEERFYNQLSGKEMIAYFTDGELSKLDVNGNAQVIMLPMENDSTYNKIVNVESSFLTADFHKRELLRMKMWPKTDGTVTPLYLAKKSLFYLPDFKWYEPLRPTSPADVFVIPEAMETLMSDIPYSSVVPPLRAGGHFHDTERETVDASASETSETSETSDASVPAETSDASESAEASETSDASVPSETSESSGGSESSDSSELL